MPRPAALSRSSGSGGAVGRPAAGAGRVAGGRRAKSVLVELYIGVVAFMPVAAVAQVS